MRTYSESQGHNFSLNATFVRLMQARGRAPEYLAMNKSLTDLPIASICHGQLILAAADSVNGLKCTAFPPVKPVLIAAGASWIEPKTMSDCVVDGNIVTGATYEGHPEFIRLFVTALGGMITGSENAFCFFVGTTWKIMRLWSHSSPFKLLGAILSKEERRDTCPSTIHDFEGDQTYSEKPGHDFTLTANFEDIDASSYDALVILGAST
ncbi:DJ-1/PfpI [Dillenia turbinata]|uniref:DJ-1/PfpI n=1 Tax=Dillenia turbinata TaxID=194707 RepID=A0AAN8UBH6_9MAGN